MQMDLPANPLIIFETDGPPLFVALSGYNKVISDKLMFPSAFGDN